MSVSFTQLRQTIELSEKVNIDSGEKIVKTEKVGRKKDIEVTITSKGGKFFVYFDGEKYAGQYRDEKAAQAIVKDYLKLVGEELQEVRGKVGSSDGDEEADKNIMMQLRKVVTLRGMKPVEFNDGKKVKVNPKDAERMLSIYDTLKPASKLQLQTVLAKSKKDFDNAVKQLRVNEYFDDDINEEYLYEDAWSNAGRALNDYARKSGGIDKADFEKAAKYLYNISKADLLNKSGHLAQFSKFWKDLDTDVREKIHSILKQNKLMEVSDIQEAQGPLAMQWRKGAKSIKVGNFELVRGNSGVHKIMKDRKPFGDLSLDDEAGLWVSNMKGMRGQWTGSSIDDLFKHMKKAHEELEEGKSSTGYELYHKDFSSAMKHAYDFAKKKFGIEVDPKEIDDKVASGPRKPSKGKTNSYRLVGKDGKKAIQVQVYGMDNGKYELNMYKESVELDEAMVRGKEVFDKTFANRKQADAFAQKNGGRVKQVGRVFYVFKEEFELTEESSTIAKVKEIASKKQAMKVDGVMVDMFTASAISQIYDKVNDDNKAKMDKLKITKLADLAMKMMKREQVEWFDFNEELISEAMMTWEVKVIKGVNKLKAGTVVKVKARNTSEALRKAGKALGDPIAVKMSNYFDAKPIKEEISERALTPAEKDKIAKLEKSVDMKDFTDRYGDEKGKSVYYATLTKMAKGES